MPIAGGVVVPLKEDGGVEVSKRLGGLEGVEVKGSGPEGIAIVLEAADTGRLKSLSEEINGWDEVLEFHLAYYNWEDEAERFGGSA